MEHVLKYIAPEFQINSEVDFYEDHVKNSSEKKPKKKTIKNT